MEVKKKMLSASRIKTLQSCSFLYFCNYVLRLPSKTNSGALRGSNAHLILELLLKPRHRKHFQLIADAQDITASTAINRLVIKHLKHDGIYDDKNYNLMNEMILVGLNHDFFCKGGELQEPELKFEIKNDKPEYVITGFMDKPVIYKNEKTVRIFDYKGSKKKFAGEELASNIQGLLYSLAAHTLWPDLKPVIQFIFLRFPKSPIQELTFTKAQLTGFQYVLSQLYKIIQNFDYEASQKNFAADSKTNRWLCQMGKTWKCPYLEPFFYYSVIDEKADVIKSAFEKKDLVCKDGQKIVKQRFNGCPRWRNT